MGAVDHEPEFLLSLDGFEFRFASGYVVRFAAQMVTTTKGRPHGIKYSLTLHGPNAKRIYGMDNAHSAGRRRAFDHRHVYGVRRVVEYAYRGPVVLLDEFYREVERILRERGAL